eukprot:3714517-Amphidinium_carterae.1
MELLQEVEQLLENYENDDDSPGRAGDDQTSIEDSSMRDANDPTRKAVKRLACKKHNISLCSSVAEHQICNRKVHRAQSHVDWTGHWKTSSDVI